ncbi:MAG: hypothetical protein RBR74_12450 [Ignavibacteriaceae bacterium]|jgi:hypothetical protein|nr:hypothetical protein [Ignavibacteriaceae bacterium]
MKHSLLFFSLFIFSTIHIIAQTPTFAGLPGPEHVLVVYKLPGPNNPADTISRAVKDYYVNARNIPASNIVLGLTLPDEWLTYGGTTHRIEIVQSGDIIKDTTQAWQDSVTNYGAGATFHAWQYFYEHIAVPIKNHLENTFVNGVPLKETIRYIVLCKGVPYKIQSRFDLDGIYNPGNNNVSLQSLLSILNNEPYHTTLETSFLSDIKRSNPYYEAAKDNFWHLDYRFLPDFYINSSGVKLSYLVTRLDGLSYADLQFIIDNAVNAYTSGSRTCILDSTDTSFGSSSESN